MLNRHAPNEMSESPLVWHYGLMAEYWARFKTDAPEMPQLLKLISRFGHEFLDLACGSGRIFTNLLIAGVDADGVDISDDMLDAARKAASAHGFAPALLAQPMHELNLPRQYGTILICDSFGLGGAGATTFPCFRGLPRTPEARRRRWSSIWGWRHRRRLGSDGRLRLRERLPADWPDIPITVSCRMAASFRLRIRTVELDPMAQSYVREMSIEKWQGGRRVAVESSHLRGSLYLPQELLLMLQVAGFQAVRTFGGGLPTTKRQVGMLSLSLLPSNEQAPPSLVLECPALA